MQRPLRQNPKVAMKARSDQLAADHERTRHAMCQLAALEEAPEEEEVKPLPTNVPPPIVRLETIGEVPEILEVLFRVTLITQLPKDSIDEEEDAERPDGDTTKEHDYQRKMFQ